MNRKSFLALLLLCTGVLAGTTLVSWKIDPKLPTTEVLQAAVVKSFSVLQASGVKFVQQSKCAACHHSTLTSMVAERMRRKGLATADTTAGLRTLAMSNTLFYIGNPNLNNQFVQAKFLIPYMLLGLGAENYPADFKTDIAVDYVMSQQLPDGSFPAESARPPLESGDIHLAAFAIRAMQLYASPAKATKVKKMVGLTKTWLEKQATTDQQELAFQLLGLHWSGGSDAVKKTVAGKLMALQHADGGWSQLPTLHSDAYATGQVLYALSEAGLAGAFTDAHERGLAYLLKTQEPSGAWVVFTRSNPIQPYVDAGFPPHDENQFISAAATNWAALALLYALPDK